MSFWSSKEKLFSFIKENLCFQVQCYSIRNISCLKASTLSRKKIAACFIVHKHVSISEIRDSPQPHLKLKFEIPSFFIFFCLICFLNSRLWMLLDCFHFFGALIESSQWQNTKQLSWAFLLKQLQWLTVLKLTSSLNQALMAYSVEIDKFPQLLSYFNFYMEVASSYHFLLDFIDCIKEVCF